jgi:hypothetical protein
MKPEQLQFSIEFELSKLENITFKPVPSDKKIGEAAYGVSALADGTFLNIEKPITKANQAFLEPRRCDLSQLNLSENDLEILQSLEKRGYIFTSAQGDRFCDQETRLYPRIESKQTNQEIIAPNQEQIVEIYTQILTQVLDFEQNQANQNQKIEKSFVKALSLLKSSFSDVVKNQNYKETTRSNFSQAQTMLLDIARDLDHKIELLPKISSFVSVSLKQFKRIQKTKENIEKLKQLTGTKLGFDDELLFNLWLEEVFKKNFANLDSWRSGINFFQARDARIASDGTVQICHLEEVRLLAPYISQARIIADALKIASKQEIEAGTIDIDSRVARLDQLTTVVTNMDGVDEKAFDLALKSVLLDTLTDIIKDAADELDPENGYLEGEKLEQAKKSTFALVQVILSRLGLVEQN